jgi:D-alanine--poly(phosphoribitol) ligase subunit 1
MKSNILEYFDDTVKLFPDKIAIDDNNLQITFHQLNSISNQIGLAILRCNDALRNPIPVFLPKNIFTVATFIGINKSGNFYVPLDVKSPAERLSRILETLDAKCIITNKELLGSLHAFGFSGGALVIEDILQLSISENDLAVLSNSSESMIDLDPIYSIFTSGSTGVPKGVLISHRGVIDYIEWAKRTYDVSSSEIIGNQAPFYFDNSTLDIYLMITTGATLVIIPEEKFTFPLKLIEFLNQKKINFIFWVPSVLTSISNFDVFSFVLPSFLTKILFAGEVMSNKHLNYWRKKLPNALYSNLYGPTEITVDCTYYIVDRDFNDDEALPIGKPCKNTQILIFSEDGKLVEKGHTGELCVRGTSLAFGYYNDLPKTHNSFIQNPLHNLYPDLVYRTGDLVYENEFGEIIFIGRKDSQIKHMGYRIELGEIEIAIQGIDKIANACVLYNESIKEIVAFYIGEIEVLEIRKILLNALPKYMIPTKWLKLESFPLNSNGKVDRLLLKDKMK